MGCCSVGKVDLCRLQHELVSPEAATRSDPAADLRGIGAAGRQRIPKLANKVASFTIGFRLDDLLPDGPTPILSGLDEQEQQPEKLSRHDLAGAVDRTTYRGLLHRPDADCTSAASRSEHGPIKRLRVLRRAAGTACPPGTGATDFAGTMRIGSGAFGRTLRRPILVRALIVAAVVGTVLNLINQGDALLGSPPAAPRAPAAVITAFHLIVGTALIAQRSGMRDLEHYRGEGSV